MKFLFGLLFLVVIALLVMAIWVPSVFGIIRQFLLDFFSKIPVWFKSLAA